MQKRAMHEILLGDMHMPHILSSSSFPSSVGRYQQYFIKNEATYTPYKARDHNTWQYPYRLYIIHWYVMLV